MLILLLDLYSLLNNKEVNREEIKAKLLRMIRHQLRRENLSLNDYYDNKKSELIESEKRLLQIDKELKSLKDLENLDFEDIY
jgi:N-glycosylase/DNA lyase